MVVKGLTTTINKTPQIQHSQKVLTILPEVQKQVGILKKNIKMLNEVAQHNQYLWQNNTYGVSQTVNRIAFKAMNFAAWTKKSIIPTQEKSISHKDIAKKLMQNTSVPAVNEARIKVDEDIEVFDQWKSKVVQANWTLCRQQVNVLTPVEPLVDSGKLKDPVSLLVMMNNFVEVMQDIHTGKKSDPKWDEVILNKLYSTEPGLNVIYAGKLLHVDYDFPNAVQHTQNVLGRVPDPDDWAKGFAPVIVGTEQTKKEMRENFPINAFNIGIHMPLAMDQFFYWRNKEMKKVHGEGTVYEYPSGATIEVCEQADFLDFNYGAKTEIAASGKPSNKNLGPKSYDE